MARSRIYAPTSMVAITPTGLETPIASSHFMHRVQNVNTTATIGPQDISEFGRYAILDQVSLDAPTVPFSFECLVAGTDGTNLNATKVGLTCTSGTSCLSGILADDTTAREKNVYLLFSTEGTQVAGNAAWDGAIGVGNWRLNSWEMSARVGDTPRETFNGEGANYAVSSSGGMVQPHVDSAGTRSTDYITFGTALNLTAATTPVLRPHDVVLTVSTGELVPGFDSSTTVTTTVPVQSVRVAFDLGRTPQFGLGQLFRKNSFSNFPIRLTLDVEINPQDLDAAGYDLWTELSSPTTKNVAVTVQNGSNKGVEYMLIGARLDSTNYADAVGNPTSTVTATWVASIGDVSDTDHSLYIYAVGS